MTMTDEVDALDGRGAVGDARAGEERMDDAATLVDGGVDRRTLGQVHADRLDVRQRDLGEVHDHDLGAGVLRYPGGRGADAAGAADHDHALSSESKGIERPHVSSP